MKLFAEIWRLLNGREKRRLAALAVFGILMGVSTLAGVAAVVPFFAVLGDPRYIERSVALSWLYRQGGFTGQNAFIAALGVGFLILVLLANTVNLLGSLAMFRFSHRVGDRLGTALFNDYIHREHQFHLAANSATLFSNIVWEVARGITRVLQELFTLGTNAVTSVLILGSIVLLNPLIALASLVVLAGSYGLIYVFARQRLLRNGLRESQHMEERTRIVNETLGALREIRMMGRQRFFTGRFADSSAAISRSAINTYAISHSPRHILECVVVGGLVAVSLLLIDRSGRGGAWLAQLSYLGFAAYRLLPALQQIFHAIVKIRTDRVAFHRIADDLRASVASSAPSAAADTVPQEAATAVWEGRPRQQIELRNLTFRYSDRGPAVLDGVSLAIPAGATVGLLGPSGSGKTTLAELLIGLLHPTAGTVTVDDIAIDGSNRKAWQSTIAYVPQQVFLFDASLAENIALATPVADIDPERLARAARLAQLDGLIRSLPHGYRERLGERGVRLSGGQRQRVGIARALYRSASVLVLDEATNALDGLTENEILATLDSLRGERTIILIAHRLSAPYRFDLVLEVSGGGVTASSAQAPALRRPA